MVKTFYHIIPILTRNLPHSGWYPREWICYKDIAMKALVALFPRKFKMAAIFEKFAKSWHIYFFNTLGVENLDEIALSPTVKEIEAILCFCSFSTKIKNARHFWNFFSKVGVVDSLHTLGVENFDEIALSPTVKEIEAFLCCRTFSTKIQNGRHFWKFFKSEWGWVRGSKISTKSLYLQRLRR